MKQFKAVLRSWSDFNSRLSRGDFWMFVLFNILFSIAATILDNMYGTTYVVDYGYGIESESGYINNLYSLIMFVPGLSASVRRLHDVDKSGWFLLIALIPVIGWIWILILFLSNSYPGDNSYGPEPGSLQNQS
jgi:uncharacterized membrane protein YhaH (DUF805 family)